MANLSRCNLAHANLCCANLERADLSGSVLDVGVIWIRPNTLANFRQNGLTTPPDEWLALSHGSVPKVVSTPFEKDGICRIASLWSMHGLEINLKIGLVMTLVNHSKCPTHQCEQCYV